MFCLICHALVDHLRLIAGHKLIKMAVQPACQLFVAAMQAQQLSQAFNGGPLHCCIIILRQALQRRQHPPQHLHNTMHMFCICAETKYQRPSTSAALGLEQLLQQFPLGHLG